MVSTTTVMINNMLDYCIFRAFQFPEDLYLEPAYWAKTGELDQIEKDEVNNLR